MDGLWTELPAELLERVLSFMPVPDLCRLRSVCKRWRSLICTPEFGKICVQNASKGPNVGSCLVVKPSLDLSRSYSAGIPCWSIFDLDAKRWYHIVHELPPGNDFADVRGMDGGLVCTFVDPFTEAQRQEPVLWNLITGQDCQTLIVANVIDGAFKVLPRPPLSSGHRIDYLNLNLVVDSISNTYKVFLVNHYRENRGLIDPWLCVYESPSNQWRKLPDPPVEWSNGWGKQPRTVMFQGLLYVLFCGPDGFIDRLFSFKYLEDEWADTGVQFWKSELHLCDLVVSNNRLFLMTRGLVDHSLRAYRRSRQPEHFGWPFDISEIRLSDRVCRTVAQMDIAEVCANFGINRANWPDSSILCIYKIRSFGFDKSVLLMCTATGKMMLYDLVTGAWESLPPHPRDGPWRAFISKDQGIYRYGKKMNYLRLPNTPW
ncbi:unnamed protein product [Calypogeia fissa]